MSSPRKKIGVYTKSTMPFAKDMVSILVGQENQKAFEDDFEETLGNSKNKEDLTNFLLKNGIFFTDREKKEIKQKVENLRALIKNGKVPLEKQFEYNDIKKKLESIRDKNIAKAKEYLPFFNENQRFFEQIFGNPHMDIKNVSRNKNKIILEYYDDFQTGRYKSFLDLKFSNSCLINASVLPGFSLSNFSFLSYSLINQV